MLLDQLCAEKFLSLCSLAIKKRIASGGATMNEAESKILHEIQMISAVIALCLMTNKMNCNSRERAAEGFENGFTFCNRPDPELLDDVLTLSKSLEINEEFQDIILSLLAKCSPGSQVLDDS